jgi:hypothetical protein
MFPLISNLFVAQAEAVQQTSDKVLERVDKVGAFLADSLSVLAQKLGVTVEYLWPTFVKEQIAFGVALCVGGAFAIGIGTFLFLTLKHYAAKARDDGFLALGIIFLVIGCSIGVGLIAHGIIHISAPEPEALRSIGDFIARGGR